MKTEILPFEHQSNKSSKISDLVSALIKILPDSLPERVHALNQIREKLHNASPFKSEPVDLVLWVPLSEVLANDYNPNAVAPPEMELLAHSIKEDGYTQPIVTWVENNGSPRREVIDGFHRNLVGKENKAVAERIKGYLPVTTANQSRVDRGDRIAATIRHNRARGKHRVDSMSEIVVELKRRNWSDRRIGKELGMEPDEVLRLTQISGLAEMFKDAEFSEAWEPSEGVIETTEDGAALEWVNSPVPDDIPEGWMDRTEQQSVLYGTRPRIKAQATKSHVSDDWHWYAYTEPMQSGRAPNRDRAKLEAEMCWE
jgi:ParB-like chromosome segregation protein Spo0J